MLTAILLEHFRNASELHFVDTLCTLEQSAPLVPRAPRFKLSFISFILSFYLQEILGPHLHLLSTHGHIFVAFLVHIFVAVLVHIFVVFLVRYY